MLKTLLVIPPDYDRNYPPLGTPALQAFLKKHGFPCSQIDSNLLYRDFLTGHLAGVTLKDYFAERRAAGRYYSDLLPGTTDGIFPGLPYDNNTNSSFYFAERLLSSEHLWRYLEDEAENTFLGFYEAHKICDRLEKEGIGLLGISIISPSQAVASLTLGRMVKKRLPRVHVTMGGQWVTLFREALRKREDLFGCFDSLIAFEGETALAALARRLDADQDPSGIPNLILHGAGKDRVPFMRWEEDMDDLPCPDFDGLSIDEYDASRGGEISLTYETSRGCYWSRCAYCVDLPLPRPPYGRKDPALVAADVRQLQRRYGAAYLLLGDPGISPRQMGEVAEALEDAGTKIGWWTMARLDHGFHRPLFERARAAGLRQINFGFESACDRVCDLLGKGNRRERSSRIIRECAEAGIKVDLQTMLGLPGETFDEALGTIDFLASHRRYLSHVTFNKYYVTPSNLVHRDPARYGIVCRDDPALPFRFFVPFTNAGGIGMDQAHFLEMLYHSLAPERIPEGVSI